MEAKTIVLALRQALIEEMNRDPSEAEIEELLKSLDAPTADLSSIIEP